MILFYFLVSILPMTRHPLWNMELGDMTVIKYVGLTCLPYTIFYLLAQRKKFPAFLATWQVRFFLLFYLIVTISRFTSENPSRRFVDHWLSYGGFLLLMFMTIVVVDSQRRLRNVILVAIGAIGFSSLYVLRDWQKGRAVYESYRPGWVVGDPNYFSVSAVACIPLAFLFIQRKGPRWERLFCLGCLLLTLTAVMLGGSRGGFLGLLASSLYLVGQTRRRIRNLTVITTVVLLLALVIPISPLYRLIQPDRNDQEAADTRVVVWRGGLRMIADHPITGVGLDNFRNRVRRYIRDEEIPEGQQVKRVAHNSYIEIAGELGVPALIAFSAMGVSAWRICRRIRRQAAKAGQDFLPQVALGLQAGWLGAAVASFFVSGEYQKLVWLLLFLAACLPPLVSAVAVKSEKPSDAAARPRAAPETLAVAPAGLRQGSPIR